MKIKCQKIPDSIWDKLQEIYHMKEGSWNMMVIVNECLNTGANYWLKKLKKETVQLNESVPASPNMIIEKFEDINSDELKKAIDIARTPWVEK